MSNTLAGALLIDYRHLLAPPPSRHGQCARYQGGRARLPNRRPTPNSSITSVGIEHHPPGLDPAWARIWFLDAGAHPVRSCRLVPVSSAQQRALELQVQCGAESLWIL